MSGETWATRWRRRLKIAVDHANAALHAGDRRGYLQQRAVALRAAMALRRH